MQPDITEPRPAPGERDRYKSTQAVSLKQGVLANLGNPSEESLDTDVSVGLNSASGFVGAAIVHHGLPPMAIDVGLLQSPFLV